VGWHADDEPLFGAKKNVALIISFSLGVTRRFEFKPRGQPQNLQYIGLGDGDVMTMEGYFQRYYVHRVPKEGHIGEPRVNFTWRWITNHTRQCPQGV